MTQMTEMKSLLESLEPSIVPDVGSYEEVSPKLTALTYLYDNDPWRTYHTAQHLKEMIDFLKIREDNLNDPGTVFSAVLGHDSVYEPWLYSIPGANEELSFDRTKLFLASHFKAQTMEKIGEFTRATVHHPVDIDDSDLAYFLDADMRILGAEPDRFDEYEEGVYREFTWLGAITRKQYLEGRLKFLHSVQGQRIFSTEIAQDLYEVQSHKNLAAMALRHEVELSQL